MIIVDLLVDCASRFMSQSNLIILISYHNRIEIWKYFKISDELIYPKSPDLRWMATSTNTKDSYALLPPTQIELILFIRIFKMLDLLYMNKFAESHIS